MCIPLHAYLIGQPHRIGAFAEVLRHIAADGRAWITRSGDIADHFLAHDYDAATLTRRATRRKAANGARSRVSRIFPGAAMAWIMIPIRGRASLERPPARLARRQGRSLCGCWSISNGFRSPPADKPFRAPGHTVTAYPDYRHYTAREYGTRVGFYRLLDAFAKVGAPVSVAVNGAIADRYPSIIADIVAAGHEIVAHSTDMNGTIAGGMDSDAERS